MKLMPLDSNTRPDDNLVCPECEQAGKIVWLEDQLIAGMIQVSHKVVGVLVLPAFLPRTVRGQRVLRCPACLKKFAIHPSVIQETGLTLQQVG